MWLNYNAEHKLIVIDSTASLDILEMRERKGDLKQSAHILIVSVSSCLYLLVVWEMYPILTFFLGKI